MRLEVIVEVGLVVAVVVGVVMWQVRNGPAKYEFTAAFSIALNAEQLPVTRIKLPALHTTSPVASGENS